MDTPTRSRSLPLPSANPGEWLILGREVSKCPIEKFHGIYPPIFARHPGPRVRPSAGPRTAASRDPISAVDTGFRRYDDEGWVPRANDTIL
jgi:hypothetical protein